MRGKGPGRGGRGAGGRARRRRNTAHTMSCSCATSSTLAPIRAWICRPSCAVTGSMIVTVTVPSFGVTSDIAMPRAGCAHAAALGPVTAAATPAQRGRGSSAAPPRPCTTRRGMASAGLAASRRASGPRAAARAAASTVPAAAAGACMFRAPADFPQKRPVCLAEVKSFDVRHRISENLHRFEWRKPKGQVWRVPGRGGQGSMRRCAAGAACARRVRGTRGCAAHGRLRTLTRSDTVWQARRMLASTPYGVFQMLPVNAPQAPNAFFTKQDVSAAPAPAPAPPVSLPWRSRAAAHRVRCSLPPGRPAALRPALPAAHVTPARAFLPL